MSESVVEVEEATPRAMRPADPMGMLTLPAIYEKKLRRLFPHQGVDPRRNAIASSLQYTATVVLTEIAHVADAALLEAFIDSLCEAQANAFDAMDAGNKGRSGL